nr:MAG TPA: hypothetical protein [Caudoviricetes sp.]
MMAVRRLYACYAMDKTTGGMVAVVYRKTGNGGCTVFAVPPKTSTCHNLTHVRHHVAQWAITTGIYRACRDVIHIYDRHLTPGNTCNMTVSGVKVVIHSIYNVSIDQRTMVENKLKKVLKDGNSWNQFPR